MRVCVNQFAARFGLEFGAGAGAGLWDRRGRSRDLERRLS